jgi:hypothetical protein
VSKHTTCDDVDEDGVKRLGEVPVRRCRRRDVDVGAVLLGTNKAHKNRNPTTHVNSPKIWSKKDLQKLSKFVSKEQIDVKRGIMVLKWIKLNWSHVGRL